MTWGARRKLLYISTTVLVLGIVVGIGVYAFLSKEPTCFDGVLNGDERGIDCGGACTAVCTEDAREPVVLWVRPLKVADGFYTAAAYIENGNGNVKARNARYVFKLFDEGNILVAERYGEVTIAAEQTIPIVEANITTGNRVPVRAFFEFTDDLAWEKEETVLRVRVTDEVLDEAGGTFSATIVNDARGEVRDLIVPVVLFDELGNAQAASRTVIGSILGGDSERVTFTWPQSLPSITRAEVLPYRSK